MLGVICLNIRGPGKGTIRRRGLGGGVALEEEVWLVGVGVALEKVCYCGNGLGDLPPNRESQSSP